MSRFFRCLLLAQVVALVIVLVGCENKGKGDSSGTQNVSGNWKLSFDVGYVINMFFEQQTNGAVQGVGQDTNGAAWSFSGSISGDELTGKTIPDTTIKALVQTNSMAGTYSSSMGSGSFTGARQ